MNKKSFFTMMAIVAVAAVNVYHVSTRVSNVSQLQLADVEATADSGEASPYAMTGRKMDGEEAVDSYCEACQYNYKGCVEVKGGGWCTPYACEHLRGWIK